ncbi:hypothetical protein ACI2LJ_27715 [Streptomyces sp. NPDC088090]|uniref:hypothetical protein n=1 Tax=Streptomyces sp. NPDC088090 TaxID=3365822 RepID=UPI00384E3C47
MSATTEPVEQPVGESEGSSRAAGRCVVALGISGLLAYASVNPDFGTFVAGAASAVAVGRGRQWVAKRRQDAPEDTEPEPEPVDIVAVLQALGEGGNGVLLTALREAADLPDTKTVRTLLAEAGIRVRAGVRTPAGNGPGVHADDIPTPSPTTSDPSQDRCLCSSGAANVNTNNSEEGLRAVRTDTGVTYYDPAETHRRRHAVSR